MRKIAFFLAVLFLVSCIAVCGASAQNGYSSSFPETPEAEAVYFYHLESHRFIGATNETRQLPAGSTGKVISGLIACERLRFQLSDRITITQDMIAKSSGYRYRMRAGDIFTVEQLLYLAICGSYNDAFDVLAWLIGEGSVANFVAIMNQRAEDLGARNTRYTDPTGISDNSTTTAEDLFRIALAASEDPFYMQICGSEFYDLPAKRIYNRNALVSSSSDTRYYNPKCRGMSAGTTNHGKCCVVTVAERGNDRYLCVVLGGMEGEGENGENYAYVVANRLIEWGFETFTYLEVISPDRVICSIPVEMSDLTEEVEVRAAESVSFFLPAGAEIGKDVIYSVRLAYESLEAPVGEGTHVGYVAVVYRGEILGSVALYTAGSAERGSFISQLMKIRSLTSSRRVRAGGIFFLVCMIGWISAEYIVVLHRRHKWDKYFSRSRRG